MSLIFNSINIFTISTISRNYFKSNYYKINNHIVHDKIQKKNTLTI